MDNWKTKKDGHLGMERVTAAIKGGGGGGKMETDRGEVRLADASWHD